MLGMIATLLYMCFAMLFTFAGSSGVTNFTIPTMLVSQLSNENKTFEGSDTADFLADFVAVSKATNGENRFFTMTRKNVGSVMVSCEKDGHCSAVSKALR